jgi:hypothetical protein
MKKLRMSVGWWMPHYEEVKDVSRLIHQPTDILNFFVMWHPPAY